MKLITAHRILISAAILLCLLLAVFFWVEFRRKEEATQLWMGGGCLLIGVVLGLYLGTLDRHLKIDR